MKSALADKTITARSKAPDARLSKAPRSHGKPLPSSRGKASPPQLNGSQSIHRAFAVLRVVAGAGSTGMRLAEIAPAAGLHVATAHRLLGALVRERFVAFDPYSRLYHIGHEFLALGAGTRENGILDQYRPVLERLAHVTEDTVYLSTISGTDAVCIHRVEGRFPIRTLTLDTGARRPLGIGGGSLALLAALPDERMEAALAANKQRYAHYNGISAEEVRELVRKVKRQGFAFNDGRVIPGVSAVALPVFDGGGNLVAAISVAAVEQRMKADRRREIAALIKTELAAVDARVGRAEIAAV